MASCVARQPIFNKKLKIYGYELLYRNTSLSVSYDSIEGDTASSETIANSFHDIGIDRVANGKRAFINFTEKLLIDNVATILPKKILVIELLEDILPTPEVMEACTALRKKGYTIALDDFRIETEYLPLLTVADIVKIDFMSTPVAKIESFAKVLASKPIELLAEKIETYEEFELAKTLGFTLFQGYFFSKPVIVKSDAKLSPLRLNCLRLIRLAFDPNADFTKISKIIKQDVALSYRLLRVVNSAYFGLRYSVNNIMQALAILGMDEVKKWVSLISMAEITEDKPDELVSVSLIRARFLELLGPSVGMASHVDDLFMLGLMSLMDAITDMPFDEVSKLTNLSAELMDAIVNKTGKYGQLLELIINYERSNWDEAFESAAELGISEDALTDKYLQAVEWANILM